jgi:hypothetical protein
MPRLKNPELAENMADDKSTAVDIAHGDLENF